VSREIARTQNTGGFGELRDFGDGFYNRHYSILHNVGGYAQVPTADGKAPEVIVRSRGLEPSYDMYPKKTDQLRNMAFV
jgi:hypothetical protein